MPKRDLIVRGPTANVKNLPGRHVKRSPVLKRISWTKKDQELYEELMKL